ncbi:hypothetical protein CRG98_009058, partial [Punica granatum]
RASSFPVEIFHPRCGSIEVRLTVQQQAASSSDKVACPSFRQSGWDVVRSRRSRLLRALTGGRAGRILRFTIRIAIHDSMTLDRF